MRVIRAADALGIETVLAVSEPDRDSMAAAMAGRVICIGPASASASYLNVGAVVMAALAAGADAIHPGYGLLSENADFAQMVEEHGFIFIGPTADHIRMMGDKITAKDKMIELGVPVVPGSKGAVTEDKVARELAEEIGYPVLIKASGGGGGRGMKVANNPDEISHALSTARSEAKANFDNDEVYIEKYLGAPRHVEIQVMADSHGNVIHLGDRDCSLQRRHQKLLEEAPSPALNTEARAEIGGRVTKAIKKLGYLGAGTFEFLYENGEFFFIEMNTRLQVEHPVTEMITGIDIVREQIRIAAGLPMAYTQEEIAFTGHSIECRINAENPTTFAPSPGRIGDYHPPGGLGVRVDSGLYAGYQVPSHYDSLISKLIVHGKTRNEALMRLRRALHEYVIEGIETTIPLHQRLCENPDFVNGDYDIHWLEKFVGLK